MKVCCIGDIHGTDKFLKCYENILKENNDCEKIIVFGDHFDPYEDISIEDMIDKYNKFIEISHQDDRIISLLGNHDLAYYIIPTDKTNRTSIRNTKKISECITPNLKDSYLCYKINDYLFSHAGVSQVWLDNIDKHGIKRSKQILGNKKGWADTELSNIVSFSYNDYSGYGDHPTQGCTWIRPWSLIKSAVEGYNQVVAHTRVDKITQAKLNNGKNLYMIDTKGQPNYLTLKI